MVVINPGNPSGTVFSLERMEKIAETAERLGIVLISDEVYNHIAFGSNKFLPMGSLGSITPVLMVGSMSKRWLVPSWRTGWIAACDPNGLLHRSGSLSPLRIIFQSQLILQHSFRVLLLKSLRIQQKSSFQEPLMFLEKLRMHVMLQFTRSLLFCAHTNPKGVCVQWLR